MFCGCLIPYVYNLVPCRRKAKQTVFVIRFSHFVDYILIVIFSQVALKFVYLGIVAGVASFLRE